MNITLLTLLGIVSATKLKNRRKTYQTATLDDQGFIVLGQQTFIKKESDYLANGDAKDDLEVQSELGDADDPVVMDHGFGLGAGHWADNSWKQNHYKGTLNDFVQIKTENKAKAKKESDFISNADVDDDKECESELGDDSDHIVTDNGFGLASGNWADNRWKQNHYDPDLMFLMSQHREHEKMKLMQKAKKHSKKHHKRRPSRKQGYVQLGKESDWIANADSDDDKEVESELGDGEDEVVTDNGFALSSGNWDPNNWTANQYDEDLLFIQTKAMEKDHFYTQDFKEAHPHKLTNAFYSRGEKDDVMNMQLEYNEIDNFNPRAQARLAKYMEFM